MQGKAICGGEEVGCKYAMSKGKKKPREFNPGLFTALARYFVYLKLLLLIRMFPHEPLNGRAGLAVTNCLFHLRDLLVADDWSLGS
jgi:hypothetical protein